VWAQVASTVRPLHSPPSKQAETRRAATGVCAAAVVRSGLLPAPVVAHPPRISADLRIRPQTLPSTLRNTLPNTLDASWDRKLASGTLSPDFTLDLHGHTLDSAHAQLDHGLTQALAQGARVVLLITGRARKADDQADRRTRRGAIRAKFLDWLAIGSHASRIAAIRPAHPRHGGAGAVYIVLRRVR
jgi:DNA-nicking Smr family endonuclease